MSIMGDLFLLSPLFEIITPIPREKDSWGDLGFPRMALRVIRRKPSQLSPQLCQASRNQCLPFEKILKQR